MSNLRKHAERHLSEKNKKTFQDKEAVQILNQEELEYNERKEALTQAQKSIISKFTEKLQTWKESGIYGLCKKYDFAENLIEEQVNVILKRISEGDNENWNEVKYRSKSKKKEGEGKADVPPSQRGKEKSKQSTSDKNEHYERPKNPYHEKNNERDNDYYYQEYYQEGEYDENQDNPQYDSSRKNRKDYKYYDYDYHQYYENDQYYEDQYYLENPKEDVTQPDYQNRYYKVGQYARNYNQRPRQNNHYQQSNYYHNDYKNRNTYKEYPPEEGYQQAYQNNRRGPNKYNNNNNRKYQQSDKGAQDKKEEEAHDTHPQKHNATEAQKEVVPQKETHHPQQKEMQSKETHPKDATSKESHHKEPNQREPAQKENNQKEASQTQKKEIHQKETPAENITKKEETKPHTSEIEKTSERDHKPAPKEKPCQPKQVEQIKPHANVVPPNSANSSSGNTLTQGNLTAHSSAVGSNVKSVSPVQSQQPQTLSQPNKSVANTGPAQTTSNQLPQNAVTGVTVHNNKSSEEKSHSALESKLNPTIHHSVQNPIPLKINEDPGVIGIPNTLTNQQNINQAPVHSTGSQTQSFISSSSSVGTSTANPTISNKHHASSPPHQTNFPVNNNPLGQSSATTTTTSASPVFVNTGSAPIMLNLPNLNPRDYQNFPVFTNFLKNLAYMPNNLSFFFMYVQTGSTIVDLYPVLLQNNPSAASEERGNPSIFVSPHQNKF